MVRCLPSLLEDLNRTSGLLGHLADEVGEESAVDQARARAGDENSVWLEHVEGGSVESQVPLQRVLDSTRIAGELGRVADHHAEASFLTAECLKFREDVAGFKGSPTQLIDCCVVSCDLDGRGRAIDS